MRGRLIQRFFAVLRRLDADATSSVVGGGFDDVWRSPVPVDDGTQFGATTRREMAAERLPVQLDRRTWGMLNPKPSGVENDSAIEMTAHWPDLVRLGLVDSSGEPLIQQGDRIESLEDVRGTSEVVFANPPGMYVTGLERAGHGLAAFRRPQTNLLIIYANYGKVSG